jgi:hypothetical protein
VHLDYCRAASGAECAGNEIEHLTTKISPNPDRAKDAVSHSVFWKRSGTPTHLLILNVLSPLPGFRGKKFPVTSPLLSKTACYRPVLS